MKNILLNTYTMYSLTYTIYFKCAFKYVFGKYNILFLNRKLTYGYLQQMKCATILITEVIMIQ